MYKKISIILTLLLLCLFCYLVFVFIKKPTFPLVGILFPPAPTPTPTPYDYPTKYSQTYSRLYQNFLDLNEREKTELLVSAKNNFQITCSSSWNSNICTEGLTIIENNILIQFEYVSRFLKELWPLPLNKITINLLPYDNWNSAYANSITIDFYITDLSGFSGMSYYQTIVHELIHSYQDTAKHFSIFDAQCLCEGMAEYYSGKNYNPGWLEYRKEQLSTLAQVREWFSVADPIERGAAYNSCLRFYIYLAQDLNRESDIFYLFFDNSDSFSNLFNTKFGLQEDLYRQAIGLK